MTISPRFRLVALLIATFTLQNLFHLAALWLAPFRAVNSLSPVFWLLGLFWLALLTVSLLCLYTKKKTGNPISIDWVVASRSGFRLLNLLLILSVIGLLLHVWSKLYLLHQYKIDCFSQIRFAWINTDRSTLPTHIRLASIMGHILSSLIYSGVAFSSLFSVTFYKNGVAASYKPHLYLTIFMLLGMCYSAVIGSRNCALAFLIISIGGIVFGLASAPLGLRQGLRAVRNMLIPFLVVFIGVSLFTLDRIQCSQSEQPLKIETVEIYNQGNYKDFPIIPASGEPGTLRFALLQMFPTYGTNMLYLSHAIMNLSEVMSSEHRGASEMPKYLIDIANRFKIIPTSVEPTKARAFGPGFLPLAGTAYHDAGIFGVIVLLFSLGFALYWTLINMASDKFGPFAFGGFVTLFYGLITSNLLTATNAMPFPFILFSFFLSGLLLKRIVKQHAPNQAK